jgi:hypothetical protein
MGITDKQRGKKVFGAQDLLSQADLVLRKATKTLTAAEVKALYTTPQVLVAAPGAGKANVPVQIFAKHTFLTTHFTGSNDLEFRFTSSNGAKVSADIDSAFLLATATAYRSVSGIVTELTPVVNAPIVVDVPTANPAQGLGSITFQVFYRTITV